MLVFLDVANTMYADLLKNCPFTPIVLVPQITNDDEIVPTQWIPNDPYHNIDSQYRFKERQGFSRQKFAVDTNKIVRYSDVQ